LSVNDGLYAIYSVSITGEIARDTHFYFVLSRVVERFPLSFDHYPLIGHEENIVFKKGDMAVYPAHGVGEIMDVEEKTIAGENHAFYVMKIMDTSMIVMIPCATSDSVGLRAIVTSNVADSVFTILAEKDVEIVTQPWNQRYRDYMDKIKTGSVDKIAGVLRDLFVLQVDKELSFGERKMMDTAKSLLIKEISIAKKISEDQVLEQIEGIFD